MKPADKMLSRLWMVTALLILALAAATLALTLRARAIADLGVDGRVGGYRSVVYLREQPSAVAAIATVLRTNQEVKVTNSREESGRLWYFVRTEEEAGWVLAEQVTLKLP